MIFSILLVIVLVVSLGMSIGDYVNYKVNTIWEEIKEHFRNSLGVLITISLLAIIELAIEFLILP